jgi:hypothetical protein
LSEIPSLTRRRRTQLLENHRFFTSARKLLEREVALGDVDQVRAVVVVLAAEAPRRR